MSAVRHRRHANPFTFRETISRPDYAAVFGREAPLEVEIGFGKGQFLLTMAAARREVNVVGLEIRDFLVQSVMERAKAQGLSNVFALHCNANTAIDVLFDPAEVARFYVHFPDPWFKKRHHKRRVVTPETAASMMRLLRPGGEVHVMTDYEPIAFDIRDCLAGAGFVNASGAGNFAPAPTTGFTSEREDWHQSQRDPIWRLLLRKPG
jgi:tRNA (guanine-N7-)-methyltransferase